MYTAALQRSVFATLSRALPNARLLAEVRTSLSGRRNKQADWLLRVLHQMRIPWRVVLCRLNAPLEVISLTLLQNSQGTRYTERSTVRRVRLGSLGFYTLRLEVAIH